ncbi:MAG: AAA family ATPase [Inquilinus sp.]|nr:AAA family ATPase [Inquilinus sp.]
MSDKHFEVFIGEPIAHRSEEKLLRALRTFAEAHMSQMIILANFELSGRQIDFVVISANRVVVVEAKLSVFPVRGNINGKWKYATADGRWAPAANGYQQAIQRKNILCDAMGSVPGTFYPEAHVVFIDRLPEGSNLTPGNFKARVGDLETFLATLATPAVNPWTFDAWRQWARRLGLRRVPLAEAFDNAPAELLRCYREALIEDYEPQSDSWIAADDQQRNAIALALHDGGTGAFVTGPSGCGKTLMVKAAAVHLARCGVAVLFVQGKDISGTLAEAVKTEIGLVADMTLVSLLKAIRQTSMPVCVFLDGLNELSDALLERTLRGVKVLARRYGGQLVVTSQGKRPDALKGLAVVEVPAPNLDLKLEVARALSPTLSDPAKRVIEAVKSGLEARMVGELQGELGPNATRTDLTDQYIRKRLGAKARTCYAALSSFALHLFDQLSYSATETTFDNIMLANGLDDEQCEIVLLSGLLECRAGRVSFFHEMFLHGCATRAYAQLAQSDTSAVSKALKSAFAEALTRDVLASIDDELTALEILTTSTNPDILARAAMGESGSVARSAAGKVLAQAASRIQSDIASMTLQLNVADGAARVEWNELPEHSPEQIAQFNALGIAAKHGSLVEDYLRLCRYMDDRLLAERRLLDDEVRKHRVPLRSLSFALAYLGLYSGRNSSFLNMVQAAQSFLERDVHSDALRQRSLIDLTSGELHFAVEHRYLLYSGHETSFCEQLAEVIEARFRREPYHVQLAILQAAGFVRGASDAALARLTEAIKQLDSNSFHLFISTSIVDALKMLGALDDDAEAAREGIKNQLRAALDGDDDEDSFEQALTVYTGQIDHPFDSIFCEEVHALSTDDRKRLVTRAFCAESIRRSLSLKWIATEVSDSDDSMDAPLFARFARCPEANPYWQDEIATFVLATRFLARHGVALPAVPMDNESERCFAHLRDIVVYAEVRSPEAMQAAITAWDALLLLPAPIVMGCLHDIAYNGLGQHSPTSESRSYRPIDVLQTFPAELLKTVRQFLRYGAPAVSSHGYKDEQATAWAFQLIGKLGDRSDLGTLRTLANVREFARSATSAIREIDARH